MKSFTSPASYQRSWTIFIVGAAQAAMLVSGPLLAADRMSDHDVKQLIDQIRSSEDRFNDALDDSVKHGRLRGPNGDVDVHEFLEDFEENLDRVKDRFKPDYSASNEVKVALLQANAIDTFFRSRPAGTKGESEWHRLVDNLEVLAAAYHASFPLAADAPVRRVNDKEIEAAAEAVAKNGDHFKSALDDALKKDPSMDAASRKQVIEQAEALVDDAKTLRSRVSDGKPSSGEAGRVVQQAEQLQQWLAGRTLGPPVTSNWSALGPYLQTISTAYGLK